MWLWCCLAVLRIHQHRTQSFHPLFMASAQPAIQVHVQIALSVVLAPVCVMIEISMMKELVPAVLTKVVFVHFLKIEILKMGPARGTYAAIIDMMRVP